MMTGAWCIFLISYVLIMVLIVIYVLGPWAKKFLQLLGLDLPLRTVRIESLYWELDEPSNDTSNGVSLVDTEEDDDGCYIVPEYEYPGLIKVKYLMHLSESEQG